MIHSLIFVLKDSDYYIMMMSTFSGFTMPEVQKEEISMVNGGVFKLKYTEFVSNHYRYRGEVDNNNYLRHHGGGEYQFSLEGE